MQNKSIKNACAIAEKSKTVQQVQVLKVQNKAEI